jgi:uncharacterized protein
VTVAPELLDEVPELDPVEQRILGCLLEKQRTVPASYPLTQNALRTACNQSSSRDPVVDYDDRTVLDGIARLKERGLIRTVWAGAGSRVLKYHQRLEERLALTPEHRALLTLLLLRGPQAAGELRSRAERLHPFTERDEVEASLLAMAALPNPLVRELERQPGRHERRWAHLLGEPPAPPGQAIAAPSVDREVVLRDGPAARGARVLAGYDRVATGYAEQFADELAGKPFDRWLLERVAELADGGPIADVGCGPGHTTAHLAGAGVAVTGFDLSPAMVAEARLRFPEIGFEIADLRNLLRPPTAPGWQAVVAWYALVHLSGAELPAAVAALTRVLVPGGWLAFALHVGDEVWHLDELGGEPVDLDVVGHDPTEVLAAVTAAGLGDVEWYLRGPYHGVEATTERLYVLARCPA